MSSSVYMSSSHSSFRAPLSLCWRTNFSRLMNVVFAILSKSIMSRFSSLPEPCLWSPGASLRAVTTLVNQTEGKNSREMARAKP